MRLTSSINKLHKDIEINLKIKYTEVFKAKLLFADKRFLESIEESENLSDKLFKIALLVKRIEEFNK